jgi:hypothetical protein
MRSATLTLACFESGLAAGKLSTLRPFLQAESGACVVLLGHLAAMMAPPGRPGGVTHFFINFIAPSGSETHARGRQAGAVYNSDEYTLPRAACDTLVLGCHRPACRKRDYQPLQTKLHSGCKRACQPLRTKSLQGLQQSSY